MVERLFIYSLSALTNSWDIWHLQNLRKIYLDDADVTFYASLDKSSHLSVNLKRENMALTKF